MNSLLGERLPSPCSRAVRSCSPRPRPSLQDPPAEESTEADDGGPLWYRFEFGLYGGAHFFAQKHSLRQFSDDSELSSPKDAGVFGARFSVNLNEYVAIEGDGYWSPTRTRGRDPAIYTKLSVFGYRASLLIDFVGSGPFRPFVQLGAGGMSSIVNNEDLLPNDQDPFIHGGLGFKLFFTPGSASGPTASSWGRRRSPRTSSRSATKPTSAGPISRCWARCSSTCRRCSAPRAR